MAKGKFDWVNETRGNSGDVAPLECWDELAGFTDHCIAVADKSCIPIFTEHATAIYAHLHEQAKQSRKTAILIERHQRLANLIAMHGRSNPIYFYLIKWPVWWLKDFIERKKEKKLC